MSEIHGGGLRLMRTGALVSAVTIVGLLMARAGGVMGCSSDRPTVGAEPRTGAAPGSDAPSAQVSASSPIAVQAPPTEPTAPIPSATADNPAPAGLLSAPPTGNAADNRNSPRFFPASKAGPVFVPNDVPSPQQAAPPQPAQQKNPNPQ